MNIPGQIFTEYLISSRIIFLNGEVNDELANVIISQLLLLASRDANKIIYLYINSPGGSVTSGMAIYDVIQYIPNIVSTIAMGLAASMGQVLLTAGSKGYRYALPNTEILMHQPSSGLMGTASDIQIHAEHLIKIKLKLANIISKHTDHSISEIMSDFDRDNWMTAEEAVEYNLIDKIVEKMN